MDLISAYTPKNRHDYLERIEAAFAVHPVCALLGPRQCGKTTLSKMYRQKNKSLAHFFDMENPQDLARLENPLLALSGLTGLIIIDEIQLRPELFPVLRVLADEHADRRFLILGSASRQLIKQSSESLAGRIQYMELCPFTYPEVDDLERLWIRGGFPRSYLEKTEASSMQWREAYVKTYLEQDIPNLGIQIPAQTLRRFWMMLSHYHGNLFNASELGRSLGYSDTSIKRYLDLLCGTFMIRQLSPWHENISKRQVKAPKVYFRDSGILHTLLKTGDKDALLSHPKLGASWEGFALETIIRWHQTEPEDCFFWATHNQAELDLLLHPHHQRIGFEFKYSDQPKITKSMHIALDDLKLNHLFLIVPFDAKYSLSDKVSVRDLNNYWTEHFLEN